MMKTKLQRLITKTAILVILFSFFGTRQVVASANDHTINYDKTTCGITKTHVGNCWTTQVVSVTPNNGKFDIQILVTYTGTSGCKELSHFSVEAEDNSFSNVSWSPVSGNPTGNIALSLGSNDPFDGFKLDNVSGIGDGMAGSFTMNYTLDELQDQDFLAKAGNDYTQIAKFDVADFTQVQNCSTTQCETADNQTATASITEGETKILSGSPVGGTWSIVSGGGSINGNVYIPDNIDTDTDVTIRYTIAADGSCAESTDDVTFNVTSNPCVSDCDGGVTSLTLQYNGSSSATIVVQDSEETYFNATVAPGDLFTFNGTKSDGKFEKNNLEIFVDGNLNTEIHVSCSQPVNPGLNFGDFTITRTILKSGDELCETTTSGCVTDCDGGVTTLNLEYNGSSSATIVVQDSEETYYNATVTPGEIFSFSGTQSDGKFEKNNLEIFVDGNLNTEIHVSCSKPVNPGLSFGDFTIKKTIIKSGDELCEVTPPQDQDCTNVADWDDNTEYDKDDLVVYDNKLYKSLKDGKKDKQPDDKPDYWEYLGDCIDCETANNTTATANLTEGDTRVLTGTPAGGTWSIESGGGSITTNNGVTTYTPPAVNSNTDVTIRYSIAEDANCSASTDDVTFTVTDECAEYLTLYALDDNNPGNLYYINIGDNSPVVSTEGDIQGLQDSEDMESLVIDSNGDFFFINRKNSSKLYKISRSELDKNAATPVNAQFIGDTGISGSGGDEITNLTIINNELYGITQKKEKLYKIDKTNGSATLLATLNSQMVVGGLTVGNDGVVYLLNTNESGGESELWKFNSFPSGDIEKVMDITGSKKVESLATHPNGFLYAADDFKFFKLDPVAKTTTVALSYNSDIEGLAFWTEQEANCNTCETAVNNTTTASITEGETKELIGSPSGGTWSIVSGGGSIATNNGITTYTPADINIDTDVTIRYTIAATADCSESSDDVTFTVTPVNLLGSIGDRVWFDTDKDTNQDNGEPGLEGATVTLDPGTPGDASDDVTMTTDANGNYLFDNLPAGEYTITVDLSTVTGGIPSGKTIADLVQNFDADGLGTPNTSTYNLAAGEDNLDQDFGYVVTSGGTGCGGNCGGVESESLGDAITKIYVGRKKNSVPTEFVKDKSNRYDKKKLQDLQVYQGKGQTMLDMFPEELVPGDVSHVTSPTDILDYTIADEVLSVDFSLNGETKGVVLGIKTSDRVYNHTKASCDRLRGAEILNVQTIHLNGHDFLMQALKQRNGAVEYAISFAVGKNNNDNFYDLQTNWYVNHYNKFNDMYNFQVWSTKPAYTEKLLKDILNNLNSYIPVNQKDNPAAPITYASKIYRDKSELVVQLRSTVTGVNAELEMVELYSETANNIKHRYTTVTTEKEQDVRIDIADAYEYDGLVKVNGEIQDAFYHADGNWGLDFDKRYTQIKNYFVWNDFNRTYQDDEMPINRNVELKATSDYDYLILYKSLLPGNISADYNEYGYLAFTAKGAGMIELGLLKASIQDWKEQYRVMVEFSEEEQTYYVPFEIFTSTASQEKINADDLTTITFNWLPTDSNSTELDLEISDVRFVKKAGDDGLTVEPIITYDNEYLAYPNPSEGKVTTLLFSDKAVDATVTLHDITGKIVYKSKISLQEGKNEIDLNFNVSPGIMLLNIATNEHNFGTTKMIFR